MNSWLDQLHDIDGLDTISWFPLSTAMWVLIISACLFACLLIVFAIRRLAYIRSWRRDSLQKLTTLEKKLCETTARDTVISLSEYLRRISIRRFSRNECAGLTGQAWLQWLAAHDPKKFDWITHGTLIVDIPYAPQNVNISETQVKELIQAVKNWVH